MRAARPRTLPLGLVAIAVGSCSLRTAEDVPCTAAAQCRAAFGLGYACGTDGFCEPASAPARCAETFPPAALARAGAPAPPLVVASLFDRSRPAGRDRERSAELAVRIVNEAGGVAGRTFVLVKCTTEVDPSRFPETTADAAVEAAVDYLGLGLGASAVIGTDDAARTRTAFARGRSAGLLFVAPVASDPGLEADDAGGGSDASPGLLWTTVPAVALQGAAMAWDLRNRPAPPTRVSVLSQPTPYGSGIANELVERLGGSSLQATPRTVDPRETENLANAVKIVAASTDDEVAFVSGDRVREFLELAAGEPGFNQKSVLLTDAAATLETLNDRLERRQALYPRVRGVRPKTSDPARPAYAFFADAFANAYGALGEDLHLASTYDATWMALAGAAAALGRGEEPVGAAVARGMRRLQGGARFEARAASWAPLVQALAAGSAVDLSGASGELNFDPATERLTGSTFEIWTVKDTNEAEERYRVEVVGEVDEGSL